MAVRESGWVLGKNKFRPSSLITFKMMHLQASRIMRVKIFFSISGKNDIMGAIALIKVKR